MYFLNGDRIYIKPEKACGALDEQIESCLRQLEKINSGKKIFKLNFFVDVNSDESYLKLQKKLKKKVATILSHEIIQGFIAQPPLSCKIIIEAFYYDPLVWKLSTIKHGENTASLFQNGETKILVGNVQSNSNHSCKINSEKAFEGLIHIFTEVQFPIKSIVRQWNYLENILGFDGEQQRYQEFNDVRSGVYGTAFDALGYPAATGIGMNRGGVIVEFVAVKSNEVESKPVDNPEQIAAHDYSEKVLVGEECVLKTTPKFERARYFGFQDKKLIFISGTASITGEKTVGIDNPVKQTEVTIQNIQRLYSEEVLAGLSKDKLTAKYGHARIYVKNRKDYLSIKKTFEAHFGKMPVVYIIADICRNNLLVEIEGKVVLE
jgi:hypothetical protein